MALAIEDVVGILSDNLARRGSVMPLSKRHATAWARHLELPRGGETVLYTGMMYQIVPYIERLVRLQQLVADSPLARFSGAARRANRLVNGLALVARPPAGERERYERVLVNIARLLQRSGVSFGYLYEDDLYAGALAHDLGADAVVAAHAAKVAAVLERHGVREVITVDPHTTHMLGAIYPTLVPGFDVAVHSYLDVLADRLPRRPERARGAPAGGAGGDGTPAGVLGGGPDGTGARGGPVVIHDSCVYARQVGMIDAPRELLAASGRVVLEPTNARALTWCCGGPAESLYPEKAAAVARSRIEQLAAVGRDCVTMCPICLVNLEKAAGDTVSVRDISDYLIAGETTGAPALSAPHATRT